MKKSDKLRKQTRKLIIKNLIIVLALAVIAFVGAFSWFRENPDAVADGISASAKAEDGLEFYIMPASDSDQYAAINNRLADNVTWNSEHPTATPRMTQWHKGDSDVTFDPAEQEFKFLEGLFLCEVTGDGTTFKTPKLLQYDEIAYVDTTQDFETPTPNDEYMSFDLYFRSQNPHTIKLLADSEIAPLTEYAADTYTAPGENYKDAAIGAVRLSVLNMEASGERELLWIPGASVYYNGVDDTLTTGLTSFGNKGAAYYNSSSEQIDLRSGEGTNDHAYYASKNSRQVLRASDAANGIVASDDSWELGTDKVVLTIPQTNHDTTNGYYYGHIRVNLWIEGDDAEARLAFVGGKFSMFLHFDIDQ